MWVSSWRETKTHTQFCCLDLQDAVYTDAQNSSLYTHTHTPAKEPSVNSLRAREDVQGLLGTWQGTETGGLDRFELFILNTQRSPCLLRSLDLGSYKELRHTHTHTVYSPLVAGLSSCYVLLTSSKSIWFPSCFSSLMFQCFFSLHDLELSQDFFFVFRPPPAVIICYTRWQFVWPIACLWTLAFACRSSAELPVFSVW